MNEIPLSIEQKIVKFFETQNKYQVGSMVIAYGPDENCNIYEV